MKFLPVFFALFFLHGQALSAETISVSDINTLLKNNEQHYFAYPQNKTADSDSIIWHGEVRYYNLDSILYHYAQNGFLGCINELYYYYEEILNHLAHFPPEVSQREIAKAKEAVKLYRSKALKYEVELMEVIANHSAWDGEKINEQFAALQQIVRKAERREDKVMKIRAMEWLLDKYWAFRMYSQAIKQTVLLQKELDNITDEDYPGRRRAYYNIGEVHYFFKDYEKAIPCIEMALKDAQYYFESSNLKAHNTLGLYYRDQGHIELSSHYFLSMLESNDKVKYRNRYDAIAVANLGVNYMLQNQYDIAIPCLQTAIPAMVNGDEIFFTANIFTNMATCYLGKNQLKEAKMMIDSAAVYLHADLIYTPADKQKALYRNFYPLLSKYYAQIGNFKLSQAYVDSTLMAINEHQQTFNTLTVTRAEQDLMMAEEEAKNIKIKAQRKQLSLLFSILGIITLSLLILIHLYRKNRQAYLVLVEKSREWAEQPLLFNQAKAVSDLSDKEDDKLKQEDIDLMEAINTKIIEEKLFQDIGLNLDILAQQLNINKYYLSKLINQATGKNFNTYINKLRVKEAIKLLSDKQSDSYTIDAIGFDAGFSNRTSFYRAFKKETGVSPSDFRSVLMKKNS